MANSPVGRQPGRPFINVGKKCKGSRIKNNTNYKALPLFRTRTGNQKKQQSAEKNVRKNKLKKKIKCEKNNRKALAF